MIIVTFICAAIFVLWLDYRQTSKEATHAIWTRTNFKKAHEAFEEWERSHPHESTSHPRAQELLRIRLGAYMLMAAANPDLAKKEELNALNEDVHYWVT